MYLFFAGEVLARAKRSQDVVLTSVHTLFPHLQSAEIAKRRYFHTLTGSGPRLWRFRSGAFSIDEHADVGKDLS